MSFEQLMSYIWSCKCPELKRYIWSRDFVGVWESGFLPPGVPPLIFTTHMCAHASIHTRVVRATVKLYMVRKTRVLELSAHFLLFYFDNSGLKKSTKAKFCTFHNDSFSPFMCTILLGELLCCILHCWFCIV